MMFSIFIFLYVSLSLFFVNCRAGNQQEIHVIVVAFQHFRYDFLCGAVAGHSEMSSRTVIA